MTRIIMYLLLYFVSVSHVYSVENNLKVESVIELTTKVEVLEQRLQEVRRDQLNYTIEKDLLKETYGSNLQIVNVVITLVLGTFTALAFFGMRSIGDVKKRFDDELRKLTEVRGESELRLIEIESQLSTAKEQLASIAASNTKRDSRLEVLEITEKVSNYLVSKHHRHALEYIEVGLGMDSGNIQLLKFKDHCLRKLERFSESAVVMEKLLIINPDDRIVPINLCEMCFFLGLRDRYKELLRRYADEISKTDYLSWYFIATELFFSGKESELEKHVKTLTVESTDKKTKLLDWGFDEARYFVGLEENNASTSLYLQALSALEGEISVKDISLDRARLTE